MTTIEILDDDGDGETPARKRRSKKPRRLKNLEVREISLVDSPAVQDAKFVLVKRDAGIAASMEAIDANFAAIQRRLCELAALVGSRPKPKPLVVKVAAAEQPAAPSQPADTLPALEIEQPDPDAEFYISLLERFGDSLVRKADAISDRVGEGFARIERLHEKLRRHEQEQLRCNGRF